jgi:hypothetical protein
MVDKKFVIYQTEKISRGYIIPLPHTNNNTRQLSKRNAR